MQVPLNVVLPVVDIEQITFEVFTSLNKLSNDGYSCVAYCNNIGNFPVTPLFPIFQHENLVVSRGRYLVFDLDSLNVVKKLCHNVSVYFDVWFYFYGAKGMTADYLDKELYHIWCRSDSVGTILYNNSINFYNEYRRFHSVGTIEECLTSMIIGHVDEV